jgi:hypothetical protein
MEKIFVNIGYGLMLIGITIKDILWLRIVLFGGHFFIWLYAFSSNNISVLFWNSLFIIINGIRIVYLFRKRRTYQIPEHLADLYGNIFSAMTKKKFLDFWNMGQPKEVYDEHILKHGDKTKAISIILKGRVQVSKNGRPLAALGRGRFIDDMGFLTEETASADISANGQVVYQSWADPKLSRLQHSNPNMLLKLQNIIAKDLTIKIKNTFDGITQF